MFDLHSIQVRACVRVCVCVCVCPSLSLYLLVLTGPTGWSEPVWLIPVSVTPSVGFFLVSLRLSVRFRSTDQAWGEQRSRVRGQHKTQGGASGMLGL